jgi:asparagine synthase (glutamine-hydrolysing)
LAFSYQAKEYDESVYINDTVKQTGVQLIPFHPDPRQLWDSLEQMLWYQDEPIHSIVAMITFELSRLAAASGVKVILNGGGPDESLAGYHNLFHNYWYTLLRAGHVREVWHEICAYCSAHGGEARTLFQRFLYNQLKSAMGHVSAYRQLARWKRSRELRKHPWFTPELSEHLPVDNHKYSEPTLDFALKRSVECAPLPLYLRLEDRNSMAHSVEARMPFLDYRLMSLAFQLPANWKMRGPWNKYVLREAMRQRIPESVRNRPDKMGFSVPTKSWFADALYEPMQDLLGAQEVRERGIYNVAAIRKDLELHRQGKADVSSQLFNLFQFEIWSKLEKNHQKATLS